MTNTRYTFTNARDFRDNAELQLFARMIGPELFNLLEQTAGGKFGYSGDVVAENTPNYTHQLRQTLRFAHGTVVDDDLAERYLRLKFARDFAERAELVAAAVRATLLINNALSDHDEELLKPSKLVCSILNSNKLTEARSSAQLRKFLAGVRAVLLRAAALPGGFRLHSTITEREAKLACVDPALMPERIDNTHGDAFRDAWCFVTLTFRPKLLQHAATAAPALLRVADDGRSNTTTIDSQLAQRAAYILHLNTGTEFVPCTLLTEKLLRAWSRADTIAADCTERQQRLMIEQARKVLAKLTKRGADVNICWVTHVDAADRCGLDLWRDGDSVHYLNFRGDTLTIGRSRVARARRDELDRLEHEHGASWDSKLVVASDRIGQLKQLTEQLRFRNSTEIADAIFELRRCYGKLKRVRAEKDRNPRDAAAMLRRATRNANSLIYRANEKPRQRQLRELQLGAKFKLNQPDSPVYTVHEARLCGCCGQDVVAASYRQSDGYLAGPFRLSAWTYVIEL